MGKAPKWRLYADENIDEPLVIQLRKAGFDVLWVLQSQTLRREKEDEFHYRKARELERYLITRDLDFWSDTQFPLHESPGLILLAGARREDELLVKGLRFVMDTYTEVAVGLQQMKVRLTQEGLTIRLLNFETQKKQTTFWSWEDVL
jgi:predicted nuclease of predicted toxin-antitoxin system